jgi:hypothetical protein
MRRAIAGLMSSLFLLTALTSYAQSLAKVPELFTTLATIPGWWKIETVDVEGFTLSKADSVRNQRERVVLLRDGSTREPPSIPNASFSPRVYLDSGSFCEEARYCTNATAEWRFLRYDPDSQQYLSAQTLARSPDNFYATVLLDDANALWIQFRSREDRPVRYSLVKFSREDGRELQRLEFSRHVLAAQFRDDRVAVVAVYPNSKGLLAAHFELYTLPSGGLVTRQELGEFAGVPYSIPVGRVCFPNVLNQGSDEWVIARQFLKWSDVIRLNTSGSLRELSPVKGLVRCSSLYGGQKAGVFRGSRLIETAFYSFQYFEGVPTEIYVDGVRVARFINGGYDTQGVFFDGDKSLYLSRPKCGSGVDEYGNCTRLFETEIAVVDLDALLAVVVRPNGNEEVPLPAFVSVPDNNATTVVEYYNAVLDHFFYTLDLAEQNWIESGGAGTGWYRIGPAFYAWKPGRQPPNTVPVCRFYGTPNIGPNSHFFSAHPSECASVTHDLGWTLEADISFHVRNQLFGATNVIARFYNNGYATNNSNHRYVQQYGSSGFGHHRAFGWVEEGVVFSN